MKRRQNLTQTLILSILLHIIILVLFLVFGFQLHKTLTDNKRPQYEQPEITTILMPLQGDYAPEQQPLPNEPAERTEEQNEQDEVAEDTEQKEVEEDKTPEQIQDEETQGLEQELEKALEEAAAIPELQKKVELTEQMVEENKEIIESVIKKKAAPVQQTASIEPNLEQPKSILQQTGAFLHARQQGNSLMERAGDNKMPTLKELKYLSYQRRIDEALMNSWRIMRAKKSGRLRSGSMRQPVQFSYEINEDGSLAFLQLVESSGDPEFDRLVLASVRHAAPFPRIPKHLGIKKYRPVGGMYRVSW